MVGDKKRGLGRGLSALMADVSEPVEDDASQARGDQQVPIERIHPNPNQPRKRFESAPLDDLVASIKEKGVLQPLIVRPSPRQQGDYEIVAGERRWRASQRVPLHEVPVIVREFDDTEVLEVAIIENIQRADLNPVDEAAGYRQLMDRFGHTQDQLATALGKSRSHIANLLRLLSLPDAVQRLMVEGQLSAGHARTLVGQDDAEAIARKIVKDGLSVRDAEKLAKARKGEGQGAQKRGKMSSKDADTRQIEAELAASLKMKVSIDHDASGEAGTVSIR